MLISESQSLMILGVSAAMFRMFHVFLFFKMHIVSTAALDGCEILERFALRAHEIGKYVPRTYTRRIGILIAWSHWLKALADCKHQRPCVLQPLSRKRLRTGHLHTYV
jgi:hypothetical protein